MMDDVYNGMTFSQVCAQELKISLLFPLCPAPSCCKPLPIPARVGRGHSGGRPEWPQRWVRGVGPTLGPAIPRTNPLPLLPFVPGKTFNDPIWGHIRLGPAAIHIIGGCWTHASSAADRPLSLLDLVVLQAFFFFFLSPREAK